jgi:hypothetical protein
LRKRLDGGVEHDGLSLAKTLARGSHADAVRQERAAASENDRFPAGCFILA